MKHEQIDATSIEHLDAEALYRLDAAAWDNLSVNALVENPFYSRQVMLAGLETIDRHTGLEALAVRGAHGALLGLFPFRRRRRPFVVADAVCNLYQHSGMPLVRRDRAHAAIAAWLDAVRSANGVPRFWRFQHLHLKSPMVTLLEAALASRALQCVAVTEYRRPHLTRMKGGLESHIAKTLPRQRRKDIERRIRRLRELGDLRFERAREPALVAQRLEQFLELENAGWKGSRGTAFLAKREDAAFARAAFVPHEQGGRSVTTDSLLLDERPLAISINLQANNTAFTPKSAYDERYRRYSPGLVLDYLMLKAFYEERAMIDMDAATTEEDHVLSDLWNDWKSMGMLLLGPAGWRLQAMAHCEACLHTSRALAKKVLPKAPLGSWGKA
jgi:CelD/BcsL family acetyltransferase involved in cellulose biosynthesis